MNVVTGAKNSNLELVGGVVWLILFNEVSPINTERNENNADDNTKGEREPKDVMHVKQNSFGKCNKIIKLFAGSKNILIKQVD